jgi:hypothetical protein
MSNVYVILYRDTTFEAESETIEAIYNNLTAAKQHLDSAQKNHKQTPHCADTYYILREYKLYDHSNYIP